MKRTCDFVPISHKTFYSVENGNTRTNLESLACYFSVYYDFSITGITERQDNSLTYDEKNRKMI